MTCACSACPSYRLPHYVEAAAGQASLVPSSPPPQLYRPACTTNNAIWYVSSRMYGLWHFPPTAQAVNDGTLPSVPSRMLYGIYTSPNPNTNHINHTDSNVLSLMEMPIRLLDELLLPCNIGVVSAV